jgi:uncharacterized damage-inducible protein DinB
MDLDTIRTLYDYHYWAHDRVLAAAKLISDDQFTQAKGHSFDTLQATLVHLMNSEQMWLGRWQGQADKPPLNPADFPMVDGVRMYWESIEMRLQKFLNELSADRLTQIIHYTNSKGEALRYPLWQMMYQVALHGVHHRSEAATMLTEFGHAPEPLDIIFYFRVKSSQ